jgi:DNA-binding NarL/FixJ family response regulator
MVSIFLVGDQSFIRQGLRMQLDLQNDIEVIGESGNAGNAIDQAQALHPDVILIDYDMLGKNGLSTLHQFHKSIPEIPVIILSFYDDRLTRAIAERAGAGAFVAKQSNFDQLLGEIRKVARQ